MADEFHSLVQSQADHDPSFAALNRLTGSKPSSRDSDETPEAPVHPTLGTMLMQITLFENGFTVGVTTPDMTPSAMADALRTVADRLEQGED